MPNFRNLKFFVVGSVIFASVSCTVTKTPAPALTGPSELAVSLIVSAKPDIITANGSDFSDITIAARDANGQPLSGRELRVDIVNSSDQIIQVGTLSRTSVATDSSGQATVRFVAPMENTPGVDNNEPALIRVLPMSTGMGTQAPHYVTIRLIPKTTIVVPGAPIADFKFEPTSPKVGELVLFDASKSYDPDGSIVRYTWNWGDSDPSVQRTIPTENHDFAAAGTYAVKLTVTDNAGQESLLYKEIVVK